MALNLNRIHDYDLPLDDLEQHRRDLFNMRCVSFAWNAFLLSSPQYWCAIDIAAPERVVESILARAQQTPLCLYLMRRQGLISVSLLGRGDSVLLGYTTQVRSIRSDNEAAYDSVIRALRRGLPDLRTLELKRAMALQIRNGDLAPEYIGSDLPGIRHLRVVGWYPSADAMWLQKLQILILKPPMDIKVNLLRLLSACSSLSKLTLHADNGPESAAEMADAPSLIDLPCLQEIDIEVDVNLDALCTVPILRLPSRSRCFPKIDQAITSEISPSDICQFLYAHTGRLASPQEAAIKSIADPARSWADNGFHALMQAQPIHPEKASGLNITKIWVDFRMFWDVRTVGSLKDVLDLLGSNYPVLPSDPTEDEDWPFESLGELVIQGTTFNLSYLTRMIGIRQQYLRKSSKASLQKVTLIDCIPDPG
ncbi:hypothetical protein M407DRAFT_23887 [Tulasnella calospora MUT 4182]|uniref:F-box domain-containing protein n=1 Tax=Tulasnella calospora MUT 4182 TaxID=1051891 RepID=A0A0C3Q9R7_9AGAM|nr:hypothetical protein M407DRAFT_23887 [Tulasnella calospora MUT 4182]